MKPHNAKLPCKRHAVLHSSAAWVLVSGGNNGLGDAQGAVMATVKYVGRQLLCRSLE
jgi:hypothetical protein